MSELRDKLLEVKRQKDTYLLPENLKEDVELLGITGTMDQPDNYTYTPQGPYPVLTPITSDLTNLDTYPYNRFISTEYDCTFDETTYILNIKATGYETNMSFADEISEQDTAGFQYTDWAMGIKDETTGNRYVYLCFIDKQLNNGLKIIIYSCDFENNTKEVFITFPYTQTQKFSSSNLDWACIRPSMFDLSFILKTSMKYNSGSYTIRYTWLYCIWNGSTFVVTDNNNYYGGGDYYKDREFGSQESSSDYFISKTIIKDSTISCKIVKSNYYVKSASVPVASGERVRLLSTNGDNTKVLCKVGANPQRIFIYDIDYDTTVYDNSFINPVEVTNVPSDLGTNGGRNLLCASYEDGVSFVTTERYGPSGAYTYQLQSGYFDMENIEWHIKRQDNFGGYISRFIGSCDYKTVFFTASTAYDVTMEMLQVETGMEFNNNDWYRVNEIENVAVAGDIIKGKYVATDIGITKGTMPDNGALNYTPTTSAQTIPEGYTSGGTVSAVTNAIDSNIKSSNIKSGITILGVSGSSTVVDTNNSNATVNDIVEGKSAWVKGNRIVGTSKSELVLFKNDYQPTNITFGSDIVINGYTIPAKLLPNINDYNFLVCYTTYSDGAPCILLAVCLKDSELAYVRKLFL